MAIEEKYALITGSSRGIGRGIALGLADSGVKVAVHYFQNDSAASETLEQIRKRGSDGFIVQADVTRPDQITGMVRKVKAEFGHLDIFISNARPEASKFFQSPLDISLEQWDTAFDSQGKAFLVGVREGTVHSDRRCLREQHRRLPVAAERAGVPLPRDLERVEVRGVDLVERGVA